MVGLKYTGKKDHLVYEGENIRCKKMSWGQSGQTIDVPQEDAELMIATSPTDFEMILEPGDEPGTPIIPIENFPETNTEFVEDEIQEEAPKEDDVLETDTLSCTHEGCDFVAKAPYGLKMHVDRKHPKTITPVVEIKE